MPKHTLAINQTSSGATSALKYRALSQAAMHRNKTKKTNDLYDTGIVTPVSNYARKMDYGVHFGSKSPEAAPSTKNEGASTNSNEGREVTRQRLGTLNFPPLNPENDARGDQNEQGKQPIDTVARILRTTPNYAGPRATLSRTTPATNAPIELVILDVEDTLTDT